MPDHPDLETEQAYIDFAYRCLAASKQAAADMGSTWEVGEGGTSQARFERDVMVETMSHRLAQLEFGDAALLFGRIDQAPNGQAGGQYYIGRVAVSDDNQDPVVVDWRAPVAEPFYRATGTDPMGLLRRRHFASRGRTLLNIDDELFGEARRALDDVDADGARRPIQGYGALISALETARVGRLGDIVATIQAEQDEIIRSPLSGVLVVQGGPGTGKTVVALHRAAYLLYTHRFPLDGQGVLVVGPNRLFLNYIEQVLPSLGEVGIEQVCLPDLVTESRVGGSDPPVTARVKGDLRMVKLLRRARKQREMPLRHDLELGYGLQVLRLTVEESRRIVGDARRRFRRHNAGRRYVESEVCSALARSARRDLDVDAARDELRRRPEVREAFEWMWPVLTPGELLNDLLGSPRLLADAARDLLTDEEWRSLRRPRVSVVDVDEIVWSVDDVPLLDEARALLGSGPRRTRGVAPDEEVRTYGHIVVDEAQDLSPMQLRMLTRRSLNGSMTIVGDIAQATGAWAHQSWADILEHLPDRREPRRAELTVGYRIPAPLMEVATRVLLEAAPDITPPASIRQDGDPPRFVGVSDRPGALADAIVETVRAELDAIGPGSVGVIVPTSLVDLASDALEAAGVEHARATRHGLDWQVTVVPVGLVKGLELDSAIVVEPDRILREEHQGLRALYVALTRATKRLALVHTGPLPALLSE